MIDGFMRSFSYLFVQTAASTDSVFAEMDQEENRVKNELSNLSNDLEAVRNKKLETTSIGQEESQIFVKIGALKREVMISACTRVQ